MSDDNVDHDEPAGERRPERARGFRDLPGPVRRLAPVLVVLALLVLPAGMTVRTMMAGAQSPTPDTVPVVEDEPVDIDQFLDADLLDAVPVGAEDVAEPVRDVLSGSEVIDALDDSGIPEVARAAYDDAEGELAGADPSCGLRWSLLAAIGRVESDHGRFGGARLKEDGYGTRPDPGHPPRRPPQRRPHPRHRRRRARRRPHVRPGRGADADHPDDVAGIASDGNGDDRRRPEQHLSTPPRARPATCAPATTTSTSSTGGAGRCAATTTPTSTSDGPATWRRCTRPATSASSRTPSPVTPASTRTCSTYPPAGVHLAASEPPPAPAPGPPAPSGAAPPTPAHRARAAGGHRLGAADPGRRGDHPQGAGRRRGPPATSHDDERPTTTTVDHGDRPGTRAAGVAGPRPCPPGARATRRRCDRPAADGAARADARSTRRRSPTTTERPLARPAVSGRGAPTAASGWPTRWSAGRWSARRPPRGPGRDRVGSRGPPLVRAAAGPASRSSGAARACGPPRPGPARSATGWPQLISVSMSLMARDRSSISGRCARCSPLGPRPRSGGTRRHGLRERGVVRGQEVAGLHEGRGRPVAPRPQVGEAALVALVAEQVAQVPAVEHRVGQAEHAHQAAAEGHPYQCCCRRIHVGLRGARR